MLTFFAVLVRYATLVAILPFVGDRFVPTTVKILLALSFTLALYPALVARGEIHPLQAAIWGATAGGIIFTIATEAVFALVLGFTARMIFEAINFGGNMVGTFMGFATASIYDPHQESQSQVVAEIQMAIAMLIFLAVDGHHLMLRASLDSYRTVGLGSFVLGQSTLGTAFSHKLVEFSGEVVRFGVQLAAPVAVSLFAVNVGFGVMAKAMPQINVLVLSFAISALVGLFVLFLSVPEFTGAVSAVVSRLDEWMMAVMQAIASGK